MSRKKSFLILLLFVAAVFIVDIAFAIDWAVTASRLSASAQGVSSSFISFSWATVALNSALILGVVAWLIVGKIKEKR